MPDATPPARSLAAALEPIAAGVIFAPEAHAAYVELGFGASPGTTASGVALPDGPSYLVSRASSMGQVAGEVVAATFAVFNPSVISLGVDYGWTIADAPTVCAARLQGGVGQLARILGEEPEGLDRTVQLCARAVEPLRPEGKPLFAGLRSLPLPDEPLAQLFRYTDQLREFRGDAHIAAWTDAGIDATEIGLLSEAWWGLPSRSYQRSRMWSTEDLDAAQDRLNSRGLFDGAAITDAGRDAREAVEAATDRQVQPAFDALGDDAPELIALLQPMGAAIVQAKGYLGSPADLAP